MKSLLCVLSLALLYCVSLTAGPSGATVSYSRGDGRRCQGTCLESNGVSLVATVAHCLDDYRTGGVSLHGEDSQEAIVSNSVLSQGSHSGDNDFALLVFPRGTCRNTVRPNFSRRSQGESVIAISFGRTRTETVKMYTSNSSQTADIYLGTTDNSGFSAGDSGAGVYTQSGEYLGSLRGCVSGLCGFFSVHSGNPVTHEVFEKARTSGYLASKESPNSQPRPSPIAPTPQPQPAPSRDYTCQARCKIEYGGYYPNTAYENVEVNLIRATSAYEASGNARSRLINYCQEFCLYSRDAVRCTLVSSPSCY